MQIYSFTIKLFPRIAAQLRYILVLLHHLKSLRIFLEIYRKSIWRQALRLLILDKPTE